MTILIQHPAVERLARELSLDPDRLLDACAAARVSVLDGVSLIALASDLPVSRPVQPHENQPLSQRVDERPAAGEKTLPPPAPPPAEMPEEVPAVLSKPSDPPRVWTPERDRLLVDLRSKGLLPREISPRLNALPGIPVGSVDAVSQRISLMRRQGVLPSAKAGGANLPPPFVPARVWTEEREQLLLQLFGQGMTHQAIFDRLCALPGAPIVSINAMKSKLQHLRPKPALPRGRRSAEGTVPMTSADVWNWMKAQGENPAVHPDTGGLLRAANKLRDSLDLPRFYIDEEVIDGNLDFRPVTVAEKAA
jgi:hypothetical protein